MVGLSTDVLVPGLETPISLNLGGMSNLEYTGYALNTLLQKKQLVVSDWLSKFAIICIATLAGLVVFHYSSISVVLAAIVALSLVYILAAWFVFYYFGYYPPIVEVVLAQGLSFVFVLRSKVRQRERRCS